MTLLQIPDEVWRSIVCDWVHVSTAIRFDAAVSLSFTSQSMRLIYANNDFAGTYIIHPRHMQRLAKWLRSRNAILRQVCVTDIAYGVSSVEWRKFFLTTQGRFRSLHIEWCSDVLHWASDYCTNLSELSVAYCDPVGTSIGKIIQHSASTLRSLAFHNVCHNDGALSEIPMLRVIHLRWSDFTGLSILEQLLRHCPHLASLSTRTYSMDMSLAQIIATAGTKLQSLELESMSVRKSEFLSTIGNACKYLTYLRLTECRTEPTAWRDTVQSMLQLQTLKCDTWSDQLSTQLGTSVCTTLTVLDLGNADVSVAAVRTTASVYRHLTSLCVGKLFDRGQAATLAHSTLEYCTELRYLEVGGNKHAVTTMLQSAAVHCLQLRTLYIRYGLVNNAEILHNLANYCVNLHTITVPSYMYRHAVQTLQPNNPDLHIASHYLDVEDWVPCTKPTYPDADPYLYLD